MNEPLQLPPLELDRRVAHAAGRLESWNRRRRASALPLQPLELPRQLCGRSTFVWVCDWPHAEPLREPLRRWLHRLVDARVNAEAASLVDALGKVPLELSGLPGPLSRRQVWLKALSDGPRRDFWLGAWQKTVGPLSGAQGLLHQRREEVASRLGLSSALELSTPLGPSRPAANEEPQDGRDSEASAGAPGRRGLALPEPGGPGADATDSARDAERELSALAQQVLEPATAALKQTPLRSLGDYVKLALGLDDERSPLLQAFPARSDGARLLGYFTDSELFRSLQLAPATLPVAVGPASFLRSLELLGQRWQQAQAPPDQPFCVAVDPWGLADQTAGSLLALLPMTAPFLKGKLGLSPQRVRAAQSAVGRLWLVELFGRAARLTLRPAWAQAEEVRGARTAELFGDGLGVELTAEASRALLPPTAVDAQRFVGLALALQRLDELTETHDEDWFRNPRAIEQLRAEAAAPPLTQAAPELVQAALERGLERLLASVD